MTQGKKTKTAATFLYFTVIPVNISFLVLHLYSNPVPSSFVSIHHPVLLLVSFTVHQFPVSRDRSTVTWPSAEAQGVFMCRGARSDVEGTCRTHFRSPFRAQTPPCKPPSHAHFISSHSSSLCPSASVCPGLLPFLCSVCLFCLDGHISLGHLSTFFFPPHLKLPQSAFFILCLTWGK